MKSASHPLRQRHLLTSIQIAATEGFWAHHLDSLKRIIKQRREFLTSEPFPNIIWWICLVDTSALFSGSGEGKIILPKIFENSVPTAKELRTMSTLQLSDFVAAEDWEILAPTFDFLREIVIQAARIGALGADTRKNFKNQADSPSRVLVATSQQRAAAARDLLRQRWNSQVPAPLAAALGQQRLAGKARDAYEHVGTRKQPWPGASPFLLLAQAHKVRVADNLTGWSDLQHMHYFYAYQHVAYPAPGYRSFAL